MLTRANICHLLSKHNELSQLCTMLSAPAVASPLIFNLRRYDNVITVLKGTKHIVLFDPSSAPALRFNGGVMRVAGNGVLGYQKQSSIAHFSALKFPFQINATVPGEVGSGANDGGQCGDDDITAISLPDGVQPTTVTIRAGEALFVPAGWAHQVTSAPPTGTGSDGLHVAVNVWFAPPLDKRLHSGDEF